MISPCNIVWISNIYSLAHATFFYIYFRGSNEPREGGPRSSASGCARHCHVVAPLVLDKHNDLLVVAGADVISSHFVEHVQI